MKVNMDEMGVILFKEKLDILLINQYCSQNYIQYVSESISNEILLMHFIQNEEIEISFQIKEEKIRLSKHLSQFEILLFMKYKDFNSIVQEISIFKVYSDQKLPKAIIEQL